MNVNKLFPSSYLKADDLDNRRVKVIMDKVSVETLDGEDKPVLYFQGKDKGLVMNKTNASRISEAYGTETDNWTGQAITLYVEKVLFQNRMVPAIRVLAEAPRQMPPQAAPAPREVPHDEDGIPTADPGDVIPF